MAEYKLGKICPIFRGNWSSYETYDRLDVVTHNLISYVSLVTDNESEPSLSNQNWQVVAKGATTQEVITALRGSNLQLGELVAQSIEADEITVDGKDVATEEYVGNYIRFGIDEISIDQTGTDRVNIETTMIGGGGSSQSILAATSTRAGVMTATDKANLDSLVSGSGGEHPISVDSDATGDLDIKDEAGYVLGRFENGHIRTKNFYSGNIYTKSEVDSLIGSGGGVTQQQLQDGLATKQNTLVSGTNIKTINGSSILGSGNITISGGEGTTSTRVIKILSVGNSYSADAFMYFPYVFRNIVSDIDVIVGIASVGSCTLQMHLDYATNSTASYYFYKWTSTNNRWTSSSSKTLEYCVTNEDWDFITFQQKSTNSADYTTISPYLNPLIDWVFGKVTKAVKIGWLMTPALPRGNSGLQPYNYSSDTFYASLVTTAQSILAETPVSFVIPEGTAIQNCRKTSLNDLGDYTYHYMSQDGVHLQQGLPCLAASYACVQYILDMIGYSNKGILGDSIRPTDSLDDTWNIISQQGNCVGVTNANCLLAQKCVLMAMKKPYEITNCGTLFES